MSDDTTPISDFSHENKGPGQELVDLRASGMAEAEARVLARREEYLSVRSVSRWRQPKYRALVGSTHLGAGYSRKEIAAREHKVDTLCLHYPGRATLCAEGAPYYRLIRLDTEYLATDQDSSELKTLPKTHVPPGPVLPYILPETTTAIRHGLPICVVESPTKAEALWSNKIPAIGLGGVLAGCHDPKESKRLGAVVAHPLIAQQPWIEGHEVVILFDSGQRTNHYVAHGVATTARAFLSLGCVVRIASLPDKPNRRNATSKEKDWGPDDFLTSSGKPTLEDLMAELPEAELLSYFPGSGLADGLLKAQGLITGRLVTDLRPASSATHLDPILESAVPYDPVERLRAALVGKETKSERILACQPLLEELVWIASIKEGGKSIQTNVILASNGGISKSDLKTRLELFNEGLLEKAPKWGYPETDAGNAEYFAAQNKDKLMYCEAWDVWLFWDGKRWKPDHGEAETIKLAISTMREIPNPKWRERSESGPAVKHMLTFARALMCVAADELDTQKHLLNCLNGTIDLSKLEPEYRLKRHDPSDKITKLAPVEYDPDANLDLIKTTLNKLHPSDDPTYHPYLQILFGMSLWGGADQQALPIHLGESGNNGKSQFLGAICHALGQDYSCVLDPSVVYESRNGSHTEALAGLEGKRYAYCSEGPARASWAVETLKRLTGDEPITIRHLYGRQQTIRPQTTLHICLNTRPRTPDGEADRAWARRIHLIPWEQTIRAEERIAGFSIVLGSDPGFFSWLVEGCVRSRASQLTRPAHIEQQTAEFCQEGDKYRDWANERLRDAPKGQETVAILYRDFCTWCEEAGVEAPSRANFGKALELRSIGQPYRDSQTRWRRGVSLVTSPPQEDLSDLDFSSLG